jgi:hypothetical protein
MIASIEIGMADNLWEKISHCNRPPFRWEIFSERDFLAGEEAMYKTEPTMTGGCQCGAVRYALFAMPASTVCHCRMCQKAVGGPFAALCKVPAAHFSWTRGDPASFRSSSAAERHFCAACGTPLTFHYLDGDAIEVTTGSLDHPALAPITKNLGVESRLPWIDLLAPGRLPDTTTAEGTGTTRVVISYQHPGHDVPDT